MADPGELLSQILGWSYFSAWALSFLPQLVLNHRRRSTAGFSPDFALANPIGYLALSLFNLPLYGSPTVRTQYANRHGGHLPAVSLADVVFALYALTMATACYGQTWLYRHRSSSSRRLSTYNRWALPAVCLALVGWGGVVLLTRRLETLDWLLGCSYLKLYITLTKYLPQAILNHQRRSTVGWSITNIALDLLGAGLSLAQLAWDGWRSAAPADDGGRRGGAGGRATAAWEAIVGNPSKLGMSLFSLAFDLVFVGQHLAWAGNVPRSPSSSSSTTTTTTTASPNKAAAAAVEVDNDNDTDTDDDDDDDDHDDGEVEEREGRRQGVQGGRRRRQPTPLPQQPQPQRTSSSSPTTTNDRQDDFKDEQTPLLQPQPRTAATAASASANAFSVV